MALCIMLGLSVCVHDVYMFITLLDVIYVYDNMEKMAFFYLVLAFFQLFRAHARCSVAFTIVFVFVL